MGRIEILDGLRGNFLLFMIVNHLKLTGGVWLAHLNLGELGYVQDAQGFVFLSGLLVGLIYIAAIAALVVPALCREGALSFARRGHGMQDS